MEFIRLVFDNVTLDFPLFALPRGNSTTASGSTGGAPNSSLLSSSLLLSGLRQMINEQRDEGGFPSSFLFEYVPRRQHISGDSEGRRVRVFRSLESSLTVRQCLSMSSNECLYLQPTAGAAVVQNRPSSQVTTVMSDSTGRAQCNIQQNSDDSRSSLTPGISTAISVSDTSTIDSTNIKLNFLNHTKDGDSSAASTAPSTTTAVTRRPGRPKGSKNKTSSKSTDGTNKHSSSRRQKGNQKVITVSTSNNSNKSATKRGRSKSTTTVSTTTNSSNKSRTKASTVATTNSSSKSRTKRGRSKSTTTVSATTNSSNKSGTKRGRSKSTTTRSHDSSASKKRVIRGIQLLPESTASWKVKHGKKETESVERVECILDRMYVQSSFNSKDLPSSYRYKVRWVNKTIMDEPWIEYKSLSPDLQQSVRERVWGTNRPVRRGKRTVSGKDDDDDDHKGVTPSSSSRGFPPNHQNDQQTMEDHDGRGGGGGRISQSTSTNHNSPSIGPMQEGPDSHISNTTASASASAPNKREFVTPLTSSTSNSADRNAEQIGSGFKAWNIPFMNEDYDMEEPSRGSNNSKKIHDPIFEEIDL